MSTPDRNVWRSELRRGGLWAIPQLVVLLVALVTSPPAPKGEGLDTLKTAGGPAESGGAKEAEPPRTPQAGPAEASAVQDQWSGKKNIDRLLRGRWFALRTPRNANQAHSDLISLLRGTPAVSVINLWAPGCEPCKREFPEFRKLQAGWGREVRFVSVQLGKDDPGELLPLLPPPTIDLYDIGSGNGTVREQLAALGLVAQDSTIPLTMVLDCRNQLRWLRTREITDMVEFAGVIKELRDELGTASCPAFPAAVQARPPEAAGPRCGDGRCEAGEHSETCCTDCGCPAGNRCEPRNDRPVCVISASGLVD